MRLPKRIEIKNFSFNNFDELSNKFRPVAKEYEKKMKSATRYFGFFTKADIYEKSQLWTKGKWNTLPIFPTLFETNSEPLLIHISKYRIHSTIKEFKLLFCRSLAFPELLYIYRSSFTPERSIMNSHQGVLLKVTESKVEIIFKSLPEIPDALESSGSNFNWFEGTQVFSKIDGHLCILYNYAGTWNIASCDTPNGTGKFAWRADDGEKPENVSINEKFWQIWRKNSFSMPKNDKAYFIFSVVSPKYRRMVKFLKEDIFLIAARESASHEFLDSRKIAEEEGWNHSPCFNDLRTMEDVHGATIRLDPFLQAGFVAVDKNYNMIQFISDQYVSASVSFGFMNKFNPFNLGADNFASECLLDVVRFNVVKRFILHHPKWKTHVEEQVRIFEEVLKDINFLSNRFRC
eukprot:TRINITY_DN1059_c0_g1_i3.p2 TRINITY_DN1059_c0_g1~~TRINITY_DN1059_c0_g1_i3.p2  ORF type:complete len:404 (-),score=57.93 TRINITY_DN1059_c0_g1_i3:2087-3298(-)